MAEITSLGVHTPVALPYLVAEGILPPEPKKELYQWETYVVDEQHGDVEEEIVATQTCVVWSQGKFIRNVYRFELEGEAVARAVLTRFPTAENIESGSESKVNTTSKHSGPNVADKHSHRPRGHEEDIRRANSKPLERALVVFLKTKVHVYFLHGTHHILDLPFEVSKVFPAVRGVILQRKPSSLPSLPPTPQVPAVPPNSFLSPHNRPSSSHLQSPTLAKSFSSTQASRTSPPSGRNRLESIFEDVLGSASQGNDEDLAPLYSLTSPLSDFGVVTYSLQHQKSRLSGKNKPGLSVEFEPLDSAETVVYVSPGDELSNESSQEATPFMLLVTVNHDMRTLTLWHAWFVDEKSLASLLRQRAAHKAAKARRRSSFLSTNMNTGATTPAVRPREGTRESFAAAGSTKLPSEPAGSHAAGTSSRKPTRQEEEEAMASQMDPDYQPSASQQGKRESRRISSLNTDVRASQHNVASSFGGPGGRRNTSFGGERRSIGHRKSRGSTPGSVFSRSLGVDDDLMDLDSSMDADGEETLESIVRHIRATFDAVGAESIFGSAGDDFKREMVVRKLHSFPLAPASGPPEHVANNIRVVTLSDTDSYPDSEDRRMNVYVHDSQNQDLVCLHLLIKHRNLWPELLEPHPIAIPVCTGEKKIDQCTDIAKLKDGSKAGVLLADQGLILSLDNNMPCVLPKAAPYRMYHPFDVLSTAIRLDKDVGRNRTIDPPARETLQLLNPGAGGRFDECGTNGVHHRRQMRLTPRDKFIGRLLEVCRVVLPAQQAQAVSALWCSAHSWLLEHPEELARTAVDAESVAFVATVFAFVMHMVDEKAWAALQVSSVAAGGAPDTSARLKLKQHTQQLSRNGAWSWMDGRQPSSSGNVTTPPSTERNRDQRQDRLLYVAGSLAIELGQSVIPLNSSEQFASEATSNAVKLMLGLHIFREEQKLCTLSANDDRSLTLACVIAQLGTWLGLPAWSSKQGQYYALEGLHEARWSFVKSAGQQPRQMRLMDQPVGVFHWFEHAMNVQSEERYPSLDMITTLESESPASIAFQKMAARITPRISTLSDILSATSCLDTPPATTVELMARHGVTSELMETLPEAMAAPFKEAIARCEREPPTTWPNDLLTLVGREDLNADGNDIPPPTFKSVAGIPSLQRDIHAVCHSLEHESQSVKTKEASRHAVSSLICTEDRRLIEATSLMHFNNIQVAECPKQPDWSDAYHFEQQRKVMQWVTVRMTALPAGDAMIHYDCQTPLLTDKYHLPGFSSSCLMQPMGHTLTTDRSGLTEEKVNWAYFHAGVSVGLRISRNVHNIDTSWIAFNKPSELTNRHAGLLLALGLSGHLRNLAKWLSFKYLTPKHTMTSVGLLLGLSASYMGSMDGLITRMLSVHITKMLPPSSTELNVSPVTQTAGLMGIGLLYYNTQHRRMSEIMLSEVEYMQLEDPDSGPDPLRDESYRLAAGFALGYINLGKGKELRGLHGMYIPERLLAVAAGPRPVNAVHVFDRATAGAVVAIALVYMKTGDRAVARKIDIPDTEAQFDHVRPDILMLRAMAKHLILWESIKVKPSGKQSWIRANLPACYHSRFEHTTASSGRRPLKSSDVPFFNVVTGLAWALSLKYAGSGNTHARDEILAVLDHLYSVKGGADAYYYDAKLARSTVRRCVDVLALAAATVMAGSGDLQTFRYLRRLHGRTDAETPYGSHFAAHLAIGVLFLAGGTYTFGTSDLAIASLICAFYPLFPTDVHDNHVHLQAFRHFWVFAAEARCLVVEEIDTRRPISMPILVTLKNGDTRDLTAPCLLPELDTIATVQTNDPVYWRVTLDFATNPSHLEAFRKNQRVFVRQCPASEAHNSVFSSTFHAITAQPNIPLISGSTQHLWDTLTTLSAFKDLDKAELELILPPDPHSAIFADERGTVVDDRLVLSKAVGSREREDLWNLRMLFAWVERVRRQSGTTKGDGELRWLGDEVVEELRARIEERKRGL